MTNKSASNNPNTFLSVVQSLANNDPNRIVPYTVESMKEFVAADNLAGLNKIINTLDVSRIPTFVLFYALGAKFHLPKLSEKEFVKNVEKLNSVEVICGGPEEKNLNFATAYFGTIKNLALHALKKNTPMLALKTVMDSILWWTRGNAALLTPMHASYLALCLKARYFVFVDNFMEFDAQFLLNQGLEYRQAGLVSPLLSIGYEPIYQFFYYAGMIYGTQGKYREGLTYFEYLLTMKPCQLSAIVVETFKKAVLYAAILGEMQLYLPGCRMLKQLQSKAKPYISIAYEAANSNSKIDAASNVDKLIHQYYTLLESDQNLTLAQKLIPAIHDREITRLPNTFVAIDRDDAFRRTHFANLQQLDSAVLRLSAKGQLNVKIDDATNVYRFHTEQEACSENYAQNVDIDKQITDVVHLTNSVKATYDRLRLVPSNNQHHSKTKKRTVTQVL